MSQFSDSEHSDSLYALFHSVWGAFVAVARRTFMDTAKIVKCHYPFVQCKSIDPEAISIVLSFGDLVCLAEFNQCPYSLFIIHCSFS